MTSRQFEQFVATERGMLVRLAMNILHHPEDADDAVAEALCKAWERREQLRSPDKMRSWVAKITVNTALSMIQKKTGRIGGIYGRLSDDSGAWLSA